MDTNKLSQHEMDKAIIKYVMRKWRIEEKWRQYWMNRFEDEKQERVRAHLLYLNLVDEYRTKKLDSDSGDIYSG